MVTTMSESDPFDVGGDVYFSTIVDWREEVTETEADDEQATPDVIAVLGFDPAEIEDES